MISESCTSIPEMRMGMDLFSVSQNSVFLFCLTLNFSVWATAKMRENLLKFGDKGVVADDSHHVTKYGLKLSTYVVRRERECEERKE